MIVAGPMEQASIVRSTVVEAQLSFVIIIIVIAAGLHVSICADVIYACIGLLTLFICLKC